MQTFLMQTLTLELVTPLSEGRELAALKIRAFKGKKYVFRDDILINDIDARRVKKYIQENFDRHTDFQDLLELGM